MLVSPQTKKIISDYQQRIEELDQRIKECEAKSTNKIPVSIMAVDLIPLVEEAGKKVSEYVILMCNARTPLMPDFDEKLLTPTEVIPKHPSMVKIEQQFHDESCSGGHALHEDDRYLWLNDMIIQNTPSAFALGNFEFLPPTDRIRSAWQERSLDCIGATRSKVDITMRISCKKSTSTSIARMHNGRSAISLTCRPLDGQHGWRMGLRHSDGTWRL